MTFIKNEKKKLTKVKVLGTSINLRIFLIKTSSNRLYQKDFATLFLDFWPPSPNPPFKKNFDLIYGWPPALDPIWLREEMEEVGRIVVLQVPDRYPDIRDLMTNKGIRRHAFVLFFVWYVLHVLNDIIILFMYAVRSLRFALGKQKLDRTLYFDKWARPGWFYKSFKTNNPWQSDCI